MISQNISPKEYIGIILFKSIASFHWAGVFFIPAGCVNSLISVVDGCVNLDAAICPPALVQSAVVPGVSQRVQYPAYHFSPALSKIRATAIPKAQEHRAANRITGTHLEA